MLCNTCTAGRFIIKEKFVQRNSLESLGFDSTALETIMLTQEWSILSLLQKEPGSRESFAEHLCNLRYVQAYLSPKPLSPVVSVVTEVSGAG